MTIEWLRYLSLILSWLRLNLGTVALKSGKLALSTSRNLLLDRKEAIRLRVLALIAKCMTVPIELSKRTIDAERVNKLSDGPEGKLEARGLHY